MNELQEIWFVCSAVMIFDLENDLEGLQGKCNKVELSALFISAVKNSCIWNIKIVGF